MWHTTLLYSIYCRYSECLYVVFYCYAECGCVVCHYAECRYEIINLKVRLKYYDQLYENGQSYFV
jgi:hypothetical protein